MQQNGWVLDWRAIRLELRRLRSAQHRTPKLFAAASSISSATIYRVEGVDTKKHKDYKPDLETINAGFAATKASLEHFLMTFDGVYLSQQSGTTFGDKGGVDSPPGANKDEHRSLPSSDAVVPGPRRRRSPNLP